MATFLSQPRRTGRYPGICFSKPDGYRPGGGSGLTSDTDSLQGTREATLISVFRKIQVLDVVYAGHPEKRGEGERLLSAFRNLLWQSEISGSVTDHLFDIIVPYRVSCYKGKKENFPEWFGLVMDELQSKMIGLHARGVDPERYTNLYIRIIYEMHRGREYPIASVLETAEGIYQSLLAGKTDKECVDVLYYEYNRQGCKKRESRNPEEWREETRRSLTAIARERGIAIDPTTFSPIFAGEPGGSRNYVAFNISEARKAVNKGQVDKALIYLEAMIDGYISRGENNAAEQLLVEAQRIIIEAGVAVPFFHILNIAEHNYKIGRKPVAGALFLQVLSQIADKEHKHERDEIRFAVAMTYLHIRSMEDAIGVAREIEDLTSKFTAFREIAKTYKENGNVAAAREILVNDTVEIAKAQPERWIKAGQLLRIAEWLIEMGENEVAKRVIRDVLANLSNIRTGDERNLEKAAVLLLKAGEDRRVVINLLTDGWVNDDRPGLTPEDLAGIAKLKLELISGRFPKVYEIIPT